MALFPFSSRGQTQPATILSSGDVSTALTDELSLKAAGLRIDGPSLLSFFRQRMQPAVPAEKLAALIQQLGAESSEDREKAVGELVALGSPAILALRQAARDTDDRERSTNARRCLQAIEGPGGAAITAAAVRLVGLRKPMGAAPTLLAFLPSADDERVMEEVKTALNAVALVGDKPDAALVQALQDPNSLRRSLAAEVLCQAGPGLKLPEVAKLLQDPQPMVRLRVALLLAEAKDAKAVSVLIALLADLPHTQAKLAEEFLFSLAAEQAPKAVLTNDEISAKKCRDLWAAWWLKSEGPDLLNEFRQRSVNDPDREKTETLIKKLGDDAFDVREKATADLIAMGSPVALLLRQAVNNTDPEISQRAQKILERIDKDKAVSTPLAAVSARLVAYRKPAGAAEALLNYLPFAEDPITAAEIQSALIDVAIRDGKVEPAVAKALQDGSPLRRSAAGEALCWAAPDELKPALKKLLQDANGIVRLRVALGLAAHKEKEAVPVLINLLGELAPEQAADAEDYLRRLPGTKAPDVPLGSDEAGRKKCKDAWLTWWKLNDAKIELAALPRHSLLNRYSGYTLLVMSDNNQIVELDRQGKERWHLQGLQYPVDAQVLPGNRVLVAESNGRRVSERNLKGEILWQKEINWPTGCQRLANGNTFITTRNQLVEVDRTGRDVFTYNHPNADIMAAHKLSHGQIVVLTQSGTCLRLDSSGKEIKNFRVNQVSSNSMDVLPSGNVLIPQMWMNKVLEMDPDGKTVWEVNVQQPQAVCRLPTGNILVSIQWPAKVVELDRTGKIVWEHNSANRVYRIRRR